MDEMWELFSINKKKTGLVVRRGDPIPAKHFHIVVEVWTIVNNSKILITQRHQDKAWGLLWECTGGSIVAGETSLQGAIREVMEEIGLTVNVQYFEYVSSYVQENSIHDVYANYMSEEIVKTIKMQEGEVINYKIVSLEEFNEMLRENKLIPKLAYLKELISTDRIRLTIAST